MPGAVGDGQGGREEARATHDLRGSGGVLVSEKEMVKGGGVMRELRKARESD